MFCGLDTCQLDICDIFSRTGRTFVIFIPKTFGILWFICICMDRRYDVICSGALMGINYRKIESNWHSRQQKLWYIQGGITLYATWDRSFLWKWKQKTTPLPHCQNLQMADMPTSSMALRFATRISVSTVSSIPSHISSPSWLSAGLERMYNNGNYNVIWIAYYIVECIGSVNVLCQGCLMLHFEVLYV